MLIWRAERIISAAIPYALIASAEAIEARKEEQNIIHMIGIRMKPFNGLSDICMAIMDAICYDSRLFRLLRHPGLRPMEDIDG